MEIRKKNKLDEYGFKNLRSLFRPFFDTGSLQKAREREFEKYLVPVLQNEISY